MASAPISRTARLTSKLLRNLVKVQRLTSRSEQDVEPFLSPYVTHVSSNGPSVVRCPQSHFCMQAADAEGVSVAGFDRVAR